MYLKFDLTFPDIRDVYAAMNRFTCCYRFTQRLVADCESTFVMITYWTKSNSIKINSWLIWLPTKQLSPPRKSNPMSNTFFQFWCIYFDSDNQHPLWMSELHCRRAWLCVADKVHKTHFNYQWLLLKAYLHKMARRLKAVEGIKCSSNFVKYIGKGSHLTQW